MVTQTKSIDQKQGKKAGAQSRRARLIPAVGLFFLAPLVGEFLLGNLPITWLWALLFLAPLYGGGALLIREIARRLQLGWPGLLVLALAYAIVEEAFVTQTLFNPHYLGLRLLDFGYIPAIGMGAWWTVFVLGIHTIWSIAVPIALVESLTPQARHTPWLGPIGLAVTAVLFITGCLLTMQTQEPFAASTLQRVSSAAVVLLLIILALWVGRAKNRLLSLTRAAPAAWQAGTAAFLLSSAFMLLAIIHDAIPASLNVAGMLGAALAAALLFWQWSNRTGWDERHRFAIAAGCLITYCWYGFVQVPSSGGVSPWMDGIGNAVFAAGALALLFFARRKAV